MLKGTLCEIVLCLRAVHVDGRSVVIIQKLMDCWEHWVRVTTYCLSVSLEKSPDESFWFHNTSVIMFVTVWCYFMQVKFVTVLRCDIFHSPWYIYAFCKNNAIQISPNTSYKINTLTATTDNTLYRIRSLSITNLTVCNYPSSWCWFAIPNEGHSGRNM
jgi:hypothetical protein